MQFITEKKAMSSNYFFDGFTELKSSLRYLFQSKVKIISSFNNKLENLNTKLEELFQAIIA